MENLGDWLYFIIIVVIGIGSMFSSAKKKKREEQDKQQPAPPPDIVTSETASDRDFWDILTKNEETFPPVVKTYSKTKRKSVNQTPQPFLTAESEIEKAIRKQNPESAFKEEEEIPPIVSASDFHDPDTIRKAVIYTEILNRKY